MTLFILVGLVHMPVGLLGLVSGSVSGFSSFSLALEAYLGDVFLIEIIEIQEGKWKM